MELIYKAVGAVATVFVAFLCFSLASRTQQEKSGANADRAEGTVSDYFTASLASSPYTQRAKCTPSLHFAHSPQVKSEAGQSLEPWDNTLEQDLETFLADECEIVIAYFSLR